MKVFHKFCLLALTCILFSTSCKKSIDYHPEWDTSSMSGKIDGVLLNCPIASAQTYNLGANTTLQIIGNKGQSGFSLVINDFKGVGTYKIADGNAAVYLLAGLPQTDSYMATTIGTITITSYAEQKMITGTFEFKGQNLAGTETKTITEGQFKISLVPVKLPETNSSTNNLNVKVDGVAIGFTGEAISVNVPIIGNSLSILAVNGEKRIVLGILGYKGVGTYVLPVDGIGAYMKDQTPSGSFSSENGTVKITSETNGRLKGTFEFKAPNEDSTIKTAVTVTEGTFDLPLRKG
ncbi:DUF6252 family protein [Pedobacter sp. Leaf194]|uniref:DUF6252 family protein n=1 Tax=Pedobacter sp. Leaf194 TaxID=1736297 RepID=UPI0012FCD620|nr:DUF6252 family protein [Pedobacter sp. Leaf194]